MKKYLIIAVIFLTNTLLSENVIAGWAHGNAGPSGTGVLDVTNIGDFPFNNLLKFNAGGWGGGDNWAYPSALDADNLPNALGPSTPLPGPYGATIQINNGMSCQYHMIIDWIGVAGQSSSHVGLDLNTSLGGTLISVTGTGANAQVSGNDFQIWGGTIAQRSTAEFAPTACTQGSGATASYKGTIDNAWNAQRSVSFPAGSTYNQLKDPRIYWCKPDCSTAQARVNASNYGGTNPDFINTIKGMNPGWLRFMGYQSIVQDGNLSSYKYKQPLTALSFNVNYWYPAAWTGTFGCTHSGVGPTCDNDQYTATLSPAPGSYTDGLVVQGQIAYANNSDWPTLNVNGLGAVPIILFGGSGIQNGGAFVAAQAFTTASTSISALNCIDATHNYYLFDLATTLPSYIGTSTSCFNPINSQVFITNSSNILNINFNFGANQPPLGLPISLTVSSGGTLPTPFALNTIYYVVGNQGTGLTINRIQVSATVGGSPITATSAGSGTFNVLSPANITLASTSLINSLGINDFLAFASNNILATSSISSGATSLSVNGCNDTTDGALPIGNLFDVTQNKQAGKVSSCSSTTLTIASPGALININNGDILITIARNDTTASGNTSAGVASITVGACGSVTSGAIYDVTSGQLVGYASNCSGTTLSIGNYVGALVSVSSGDILTFGGGSLNPSTQQGLYTFIYSAPLGVFITDIAEARGIYPGVPYEALIDIANAANTNLWMNVNCNMNMDDGSVGSIASLIHDRLYSQLNFTLEYCNEVWNGGQYWYGWHRLFSGHWLGIGVEGDDVDIRSSNGWHSKRIQDQTIAIWGASSRYKPQIGSQFGSGQWAAQEADEFEGARLSPTSGPAYANAIYTQNVGSTNYSQAPNRPIDKAQYISVAPYFQGSQCSGGLFSGLGNNYSGYSGAADDWLIGNTTASRAFFYADIMGAASGETGNGTSLYDIFTKNATGYSYSLMRGWDNTASDMTTTTGHHIGILQYEGAMQCYEPTMTADFISTATASFSTGDTSVHIGSCGGIVAGQEITDTFKSGEPLIGYVSSCSGGIITLKSSSVLTSFGAADILRIVGCGSAAGTFSDGLGPGADPVKYCGYTNLGFQVGDVLTSPNFPNLTFTLTQVTGNGSPLAGTIVQPSSGGGTLTQVGLSGGHGFSDYLSGSLMVDIDIQGGTNNTINGGGSVVAIRIYSGIMEDALVDFKKSTTYQSLMQCAWIGLGDPVNDPSPGCQVPGMQSSSYSYTSGNAQFGMAGGGLDSPWAAILWNIYGTYWTSYNAFARVNR